MRYTKYHNGIAVIKDKALHKEAMAELAKYEDAKEKTNMTNADKIRAMSNSELAVVMMCPYDMTEPLPESCTFKGCMECCQEWLRSKSD